MDALLAKLDNLALTDGAVVNNTPFDLQYIPSRATVVSNRFIPFNTILGVIIGRQCYYEEYVGRDGLKDYVILSQDSDLIIDVTGVVPRHILSQVRNGYLEDKQNNCTFFFQENFTTGETTVYIQTILDIHPGDELIV